MEEKFGIHCFYGDAYIEIKEGIDLSEKEVMQKVHEILEKLSDHDFKVSVTDLEMVDYIPGNDKPPKWRRNKK